MNTNKQELNRVDFLDFLQGYRACMLWANALRYSEAGELDSANLSGEECEYRASEPRAFFAGAFLLSSARDCAAFMRDNAAALALASEVVDFERAGHLFALSRNGHGAGFFDYEYGQDAATAAAFRSLQDAARAWGESSVLLEMVPDETGPDGEPLERASGF